SMHASPRAPAQSYRALQAIFDQQDLRRYADDMDCSAIDALVSASGYLAGYGHSVQVCDEQGACCGQAPGGENVWASTIVLAGDEVYRPVEVTLFVYREVAGG
ncbi:MAG: hypothetical protein JXC85_04035, partial [Candidatus Aenigmarchaeota archaeon]|nr:hypothetical protein [Candidatus Aenigmarchaeota archaeon]